MADNSSSPEQSLKILPENLEFLTDVCQGTSELLIEHFYTLVNLLRHGIRQEVAAELVNPFTPVLDGS
ncbi:hypothetical protein NliqN6_1527 [Naganishia liquefaciens]|uniref:Uncharacterized protein n=1 Tax=Naganishia liquefaciens TaxID=104408 RepID=A0A8H3TR85_9TREE|nr:hypothetical protein NliqN6_1527 [Naganishia liquefaciens]